MGIIIFLCKVNFSARCCVVIIEGRNGFGRLDHIAGKEREGSREKEKDDGDDFHGNINRFLNKI